SCTSGKTRSRPTSPTMRQEPGAPRSPTNSSSGWDVSGGSRKRPKTQDRRPKTEADRGKPALLPAGSGFGLRSSVFERQYLAVFQRLEIDPAPRLFDGA